MINKQYAYTAGWIALAAMAVFFVLGLVRNPTLAARKEIERQLADVANGEIDLSLASDAESAEWQRGISGRPNIWGPLVPPQKVEAPPPSLQDMLRGVEPTRNKIGSGAAMKVQIRVDGKKEYYGVGDQVKGCAIKEITDAHVLFTLVKDGKTYGIPLPRR